MGEITKEEEEEEEVLLDLASALTKLRSFLSNFPPLPLKFSEGGMRRKLKI